MLSPPLTNSTIVPFFPPPHPTLRIFSGGVAMTTGPQGPQPWISEEWGRPLWVAMAIRWQRCIVEAAAGEVVGEAEDVFEGLLLENVSAQSSGIHGTAAFPTQVA